MLPYFKKQRTPFSCDFRTICIFVFHQTLISFSFSFLISQNRLIHLIYCKTENEKSEEIIFNTEPWVRGILSIFSLLSLNSHVSSVCFSRNFGRKVPIMVIDVAFHFFCHVRFTWMKPRSNLCVWNRKFN